MNKLIETSTPRTNAEVERLRLLRYHETPQIVLHVSAEFARQLEQELIKVKKSLLELSEAVLKTDGLTNEEHYVWYMAYSIKEKLKMKPEDMNIAIAKARIERLEGALNSLGEETEDAHLCHGDQAGLLRALDAATRKALAALANNESTGIEMGPSESLHQGVVPWGFDPERHNLCAGQDSPYSATAAQRAEAFLRALNLWID